MEQRAYCHFSAISLFYLSLGVANVSTSGGRKKAGICLAPQVLSEATMAICSGEHEYPLALGATYLNTQIVEAQVGDVHRLVAFDSYCS